MLCGTSKDIRNSTSSTGRVLQTSGICRREFRHRSRQTQVYKWIHLSFVWSTYLMGLIASIAHGFTHCRKRASGYHPLYEGSLTHPRPTTWAQVQWIRENQHRKRLDWSTFRRFLKWILSKDQASLTAQVLLHGAHREWTDQCSSCTRGYTTCGHLHEDNEESSTPETCGLDSSIRKLKIQTRTLSCHSEKDHVWFAFRIQIRGAVSSDTVWGF